MKDPNDIYGVEYEAIAEVQVLAEGGWNGYPYDAQFIEDMAEVYDIACVRAKLIADHKQEGPALGHVLALRAEADPNDEGSRRLMARIGFLEVAKGMIESGAWNERSIGWSDYLPTPGIPYLWEVSLLGAQIPASPGMEPLEFDAEEAEGLAAAEAADLVTLVATDAELAGMIETRRTLVWDITDQYIRYRVRAPGRFRKDTFRTVALSEKKGLWSVQGRLKSQYVPEGRDAQSLVLQAVLFSKDKKYKWTLRRAKAWVKGHKDELSAAEAPEGHVTTLAAGGEGAETIKTCPEAEATVVALCEATKGGQDMAETDPGDGKKGVTTTDPPPEPDPNPDPKPELKPAPDPVTVQPESAAALRVENERLLAEMDRMNAQALAGETAHNAALKTERAEKRVSIIGARVYALQAAGFIAPAQVNFGLVQALTHIPDDAMVSIKGKDVPALDVILEVLKHGGQLKLKHEFAAKPSVPGAEEEAQDADLDLLDSQGMDTRVERKKREILRAAKEGEEPSAVELQVMAMTAVEKEAKT